MSMSLVSSDQELPALVLAKSDCTEAGIQEFLPRKVKRASRRRHRGDHHRDGWSPDFSDLEKLLYTACGYTVHTG